MPKKAKKVVRWTKRHRELIDACARLGVSGSVLCGMKPGPRGSLVKGGR